MIIRFKYDMEKSEIIKKNPKRGISFKEAEVIFSRPYYEDYRSDDPEQFRVIGWVNGSLFSLIYEIREDSKGEYYHFVTLWKSTKEEVRLYEKNR
jgi:uncharacterized DUF497 family protein